MTGRTTATRTRRHIDMALQAIHHDRWVVGGLRDGRLRVIAQSTVAEGAPAQVLPIYQDLSPLARRCLYERQPLALNSLIDPREHQDDWEIHWPAIVYAPIGLVDARPVGLLIVGSRSQHWYQQAEIDYIAALGIALTAAVSCVTGPLGRLTPRERRFAILIAEGLSDEEIGRALAVDTRVARRASDQVLRKLSIRSRHEVRDLVPGLSMSTRALVL